MTYNHRASALVRNTRVLGNILVYTENSDVQDFIYSDGGEKYCLLEKESFFRNKLADFAEKTSKAW